MLCYMFLCSCFAARVQSLWTEAPEDPHLDGKVVKVNVIYRHGHREPLITFPSDPHEHSPLWIYGKGELTNLGRRQAYKFGQNLHARYKKLLPKKQAYKVVKAYSSKFRRNMMTSAVVLAGLLPPAPSEMWSKLRWQPAVTQIFDMLTTSSLNCPKLDALKQNFRQETEPKQLYYSVSFHSGRTVTNPTKMLNIYTCLEIQRQVRLKWPEWARKYFPKIQKEAARAFDVTDEIARLKLGRVLDKIISYNELDDTRIRLYCTHDTVIGGLMSALNFSLNLPPNFLSALIVEFRSLRGKTYVQLWYRQGPFDSLVRLYWPKCGVRCTVDELRIILDHLIPKNWEEECRVHAIDKNLHAFGILAMVLTLLGMAVTFTITLISKCGSFCEYFCRFSCAKKTVKLKTQQGIAARMPESQWRSLKIQL